MSRRIRHPQPKVSFIIPTLNAADTLQKCLEAISAQDYPKKNIDIVISDGGSTDDTLRIAKKYNVRIINNPEVLHEPGKSRASRIARGDILFYTDADNILSHRNWLNLMVKPYIDNPRVMGFLPQTLPAPDTNVIDRYLGYLFTDPFTWFTYYPATNPMDYDQVYRPFQISSSYKLYRFPVSDPPLFGLSQGVGTNRLFRRSAHAYADDLLAGIKLIQEGGIVAYVPDAGVYHYHVSGIGNFIKKYAWRVKNNIRQDIKLMGISQRLKYLPAKKRMRMFLFPLYSASLIFPIIDAIRLSIKHKDMVMFLHVPLSILMSCIIIGVSLSNVFTKTSAGSYE